MGSTYYPVRGVGGRGRVCLSSASSLSILLICLLAKRPFYEIPPTQKRGSRAELSTRSVHTQVATTVYYNLIPQKVRYEKPFNNKLN